jgi:hypothetical protein
MWSLEKAFCRMLGEATAVSEQGALAYHLQEEGD